MAGILCLMLTATEAQEIKFGDVGNAELASQVYEADSTAAAAVLYRNVTVKYNYVPSDGFHVLTYVHERIKIYNPNGFEFATVREQLYRNGSDNESLSGLKGYTYNMENGEVVRTKIKGSDSFKKELNQYYYEEAFTMPNVKAGSIIEYEYRLDSPFSYLINEIKLQYDIPIQRQEISVAIPEYYHFKPQVKGYLLLNPTYGSKQDQISLMSRSSTGRRQFINTSSMTTRTVNYQVLTTNFKMKDVPALKEEPYVNDMDNYRSTIQYELQFVQFPQSTVEHYTTNWEEVVKTIFESSDFGRQIDQERYFREPLETITANSPGQLETAATIFRHMQDRMAWNGLHGFYTDKGVKKSYEERSGNIADINLGLVAMLRAAGLKASPVLISTRDHGVPLFPTIRGFNYVAALVELEQGNLLLDASDKFVKPNQLPTRALNWSGKIVREDGTYTEISLMPSQLSKEVCMLTAQLTTNGDVHGKLRNTRTNYRALAYRSKYSDIGTETYLDELEGRLDGMEIDNYEIDNKANNQKPVVETFDFQQEGIAGKAGDKLIFNPMLGRALTENPFRLEKRDYPVDFTYPWDEKMILNLNLPEGYEVLEMPADLAIALENNAGSFSYQIRQMANRSLQVLVQLNVNQAVIPAANYPALKEFYKKVVEKESEKVVLSKITSDEHTERPAGSR